MLTSLATKDNQSASYLSKPNPLPQGRLRQLLTSRNFLGRKYSTQVNIQINNTLEEKTPFVTAKSLKRRAISFVFICFLPAFVCWGSGSQRHSVFACKQCKFATICQCGVNSRIRRALSIVLRRIASGLGWPAVIDTQLAQKEAYCLLATKCLPFGVELSAKGCFPKWRPSHLSHRDSLSHDKCNQAFCCQTG